MIEFSPFETMGTGKTYESLTGQSNPVRISSNPLIVHPPRDLKVLHRTPNERVFHCCNQYIPFQGKHGHYIGLKPRWKKSLRDHKS